jgi:hypothetical protein
MWLHLTTVLAFVVLCTSCIVFGSVCHFCVVEQSKWCMTTLTHSWRERCLINGRDLFPYCSILVLSCNFEVCVILTYLAAISNFYTGP